MTEYKAVKLTPHDAQKELSHQRRNLHRLRAEFATTCNPDSVQRYMDFARLAIICAKHGYMCMI